MFIPIQILLVKIVQIKKIYIDISFDLNNL